MGQRVERAVGIAKNTVKGAAAAGALVIAGPPAVSAVFGSLGHKLKTEETHEVAEERYQEAFKRASPAGKFVLQYLTTTEVAVHKYKGNHGLLSAMREGFDGHIFDDFVRVVKINNACLGNTSYDIAGGSMKGTAKGLLSSATVEGKMPTAAATAHQNPENPDELIVQSGHSNSIDLTFTGLKSETALAPADEQTRRMLGTYGCNTGVLEQVESHTVYDTSSDYIRTGGLVE